MVTWWLGAISGAGKKERKEKGNLILLPNSENPDRQAHGGKGWEQLGAAFLILWELAAIFW